MRTNTLIHRGLRFTVQHERDDAHGAPWEDGDGRGVVTDWLYYPDDPNLRKLGSGERDGTARYFDQAATLAKAIEEQWGVGSPVEPPGASEAEIRALAVEHEYQFLNGWCSNDWEYIGVIVTLADTKISRSLWGIESNAGDYLDEVARELADLIISEAATEVYDQAKALITLAAKIEAAQQAVTP